MDGSTKQASSSKDAAALPEEKSHAGVSQETPDGGDRKIMLDVGKKSKGAVLADEIAEEEGFVLRLTPSDEEDLIEEVIELKGNDNAAMDLLEKYFSDIESSDDSQVYEPKTSRPDGKRGAAAVVSPVVEAVKESGEESKQSVGSNKSAQEKLIGLEFEPVESDEEYFEDFQQSGADVAREKGKQVDVAEESAASSSPAQHGDDDTGGEVEAGKQSTVRQVVREDEKSEGTKGTSVEDECSFASPSSSRGPLAEGGEDTMTQELLDSDSKHSEGRDDIFYSPTGDVGPLAEEKQHREDEPDLDDLVELVSEEEDILEQMETFVDDSPAGPSSAKSEVGETTAAEEKESEDGTSLEERDDREGTPLNDETPEEEIQISETVEISTEVEPEDAQSQDGSLKSTPTPEMFLAQESGDADQVNKEANAPNEPDKSLKVADKTAEKSPDGMEGLDDLSDDEISQEKLSQPQETGEELLLQENSSDEAQDKAPRLSKSAEELLLEEDSLEASQAIDTELQEIAEDILLEENSSEVLQEEPTEPSKPAEDALLESNSSEGSQEKHMEPQEIAEDILLEESPPEASQKQALTPPKTPEDVLLEENPKGAEEDISLKENLSEASQKLVLTPPKNAEDVLLRETSAQAPKESVPKSPEVHKDALLEKDHLEASQENVSKPQAKDTESLLKASQEKGAGIASTSSGASNQPKIAEDVLMEEDTPSLSQKRALKRPRCTDDVLLEKNSPEPEAPQEKVLKTTPGHEETSSKALNPFKTLEEIFMEEDLAQALREKAAEPARTIEEPVLGSESQEAVEQLSDSVDEKEQAMCINPPEKSKENEDKAEANTEKSLEKADLQPSVLTAEVVVLETSEKSKEILSEEPKAIEHEKEKIQPPTETKAQEGSRPEKPATVTEGRQEAVAVPGTVDKPDETEAKQNIVAKQSKKSEVVATEVKDHKAKSTEEITELGPKAITDEPAEAPTKLVKTLVGADPKNKDGATLLSGFGPDIEPIKFPKQVAPKPCCSKDIEMLELSESMERDDKQKRHDASAQSSAAAPSPTSDEEDSLLVIDTSHREEDSEAERAEAAAQQSSSSSSPSPSPTPSTSSEEELEAFFGKECMNYDCDQTSDVYFLATVFGMNYYKVCRKRKKAQYLCENCYDKAIASYEEMCKLLRQKQPLLQRADFRRQEFVEIIDSSDEEDSDDTEDSSRDENALPRDSIDLLSAELETAIRKVMNSVDIHNQLTWTKQILSQRLDHLTDDAESVSERLLELQKRADHMHNSLYQCPKIKIRQLTPLDLNSGRTFQTETEETIPPAGEIVRADIQVNETYYAVKNKAIASWVPCKVIEALENYGLNTANLKHYKIKFLKSKYPMLKTVSAKHMAFFNPPDVRLPIGTRVIAFFDASSLCKGKDKLLIPSAFYPGIVAEPLKEMNKFRYLVFYDDGYFQYVYHKDIRLVCNASDYVWEDVHHQSREFIRSYLTQYTVNRPMVHTQKGQSMLVDYMGKWIYARVIDVDCSLVQVLFEAQHRSEWIYRGSARLGPVYKEYNNLTPRNNWSSSRAVRRSEPYVRYVSCDDVFPTPKPPMAAAPPPPQQLKPGEVRSVAKKSVSRVDSSSSSTTPVPTVRHLNNSTIFVDDDNKPKGKVVYYTARKNVPPRKYVTHECNPACTYPIAHNLQLYSSLAKPLLSGWERQILRQKSKKFIIYRGPCGKRLRSMDELHKYLRLTDNELNVDNFDFGVETNCLAEYVIESCIVQRKDISNGKELMPIPCVNYYDNTMPPDCIYSSRRIPTEGVPLNLDKEFLVGCDCEDDCSDKAKCSCWELTYAGAKYGMPNVPNEMVGYQFKRLYEHVPTGIYECNSRCKCKANCINRVVQQPLQSKLQVFKTSNRGWGLRCINDVPRGSFICIYAGHLLTEQKANEGGLDAGDEYFAELDYIEVAEQIKEGYESDVVEPDEDEDLYNPDNDDDDEFVAPGESSRSKSFNTRLRTRRSTKSSTDAEHVSQERQVMSFEPNKTIGQPDNSNSEKPTIRKLFGKDEACYIMDAKITGNLGRYFNHSCSPNLFVQNVFVDTHDLRFPWVAFFAFTHIRAGTELTWNYNYEVGVVPGKVLYCQCGAPNCRQRLL